MARLQDALNRQPPDPTRRYEVLNVALAGSNAKHAAGRLHATGMRFSPQMVIYGVTINDLEGSPAYRQTCEDRAMAMERHWRNCSMAPVCTFCGRYGPESSSSFSPWLPPRGTYIHEILDNWLHNRAAQDWFEQQLDRFRARANSAGIFVQSFSFIRP